VKLAVKILKMPTEIENLNPSVYGKIKERVITANEEDESVADPFDKREIFGAFVDKCDLVWNVLKVFANCRSDTKHQ